MIGAHYDTLAEPQGFVGANNGTAVVIEAARALARLPRSAGVREIRFVLFDGEEPAAGLPEESADFYHHGLRGSRAYVATHRHRRRRGGLRAVGMSLGGDRFIEAPRTGLKVRISSLDNPYYAQQFTGARRFDPAVNHDVVGQVQPGAEGLGAAAAQSPPDRDAARVMPALRPDQINWRP